MDHILNFAIIAPIDPVRNFRILRLGVGNI